MASRYSERTQQNHESHWSLWCEYKVEMGFKKKVSFDNFRSFVDDLLEAGYAHQYIRNAATTAVRIENENNNIQVGTLASLDYDNWKADLSRMLKNYEPNKARPIFQDDVVVLSEAEQRVLSLWTQTGLRRDSFISLQASDLVCREINNCQLLSIRINRLKAWPKGHSGLIPIMCCCDVSKFCFVHSDLPSFPVSKVYLSKILDKVSASFHSPRRTAALFVRPFILEALKTASEKEGEIIKRRFEYFFGWSVDSPQLANYTKDAAAFQHDELLTCFSALKWINAECELPIKKFWDSSSWHKPMNIRQPNRALIDLAETFDTLVDAELSLVSTEVKKSKNGSKNEYRDKLLAELLKKKKVMPAKSKKAESEVVRVPKLSMKMQAFKKVIDHKKPATNAKASKTIVRSGGLFVKKK